MTLFRRVEFKTYDGTTLRGDLYEVPEKNAPAIIMSQGVALLKDHYLSNWAERFQAAGYAVLIYDHRNWGLSDGQVRDEVNPQIQAEDYSDAVTYVQSLAPAIDPSRVVLWGIGHSGGAAGTAASLDPRIKGCILVIASLGDRGRFPEELVAKAWKQRALGQEKSVGEYVQLWPVNEEEAASGAKSLVSGEFQLKFWQGAHARSEAAGNPYSNKMTLNSIYHLTKATPAAYFPHIKHKVLYMPPTGDIFGASPEEHREVFDKIQGKKTWYLMKYTHLKNYFGTPFEESVKVMLDWLKAEI